MIFSAAELEEIGLVAIVRTTHSAHVVSAVSAMAAGGVRATEITLNTPDALELIAALREEFSPIMRIGAGTILGAADANAAMDAGAEFVITPTLQFDSIAACRDRGVPILCGCMTPTEALLAHRAGADFIKVFPADSLGVAFVKAILGPLPFLKLIPTGGVGLENVAEFIKAGCAGVALGSGLVSQEILAEQDWPRLTRRAESFVAALAEARFPSA